MELNIPPEDTPSASDMNNEVPIPETFRNPEEISDENLLPPSSEARRITAPSHRRPNPFIEATNKDTEPGPSHAIGHISIEKAVQQTPDEGDSRGAADNIPPIEPPEDPPVPGAGGFDHEDNGDDDDRDLGALDDSTVHESLGFNELVDELVGPIPEEAPTLPNDTAPEAHNDIVVSPPGEFLSFRVPFDGTQAEIPLSEQDDVMTAFSEHLDKTLEARSFVKHHTTIDGKEVAVMLYKNIDLNGNIKRLIHLQELQEGEWAGDGSHWAQDNDSSVIRHDYALPSWEEQEALIIAGSPPFAPEFSHNPNDRANLYLAADLGLNDQPIGMDEARALFDLTNRVIAQEAARGKQGRI